MSSFIFRTPHSQQNIPAKTSRLSIYLGAFATLLKEPQQVDIDSLPVVTLPPTLIEHQHLADYQSACGFKREGKVPITYPQVIGFNALMTLMTHRNFSLPVVGMVHTHNKVENFADINCNETISQETRLLSCEEVEKGFQCTIEVLTLQKEILANRISSRYLYRTNTKIEKRVSKSKANLSPAPEFLNHSLNADEKLIRRYAMVSGDLNPIHLCHFTARLFGFKKMIAHGMWSIARVIAEFSSQLQRNPNEQKQLKEIEVDFRKPIYLPSELAIDYDNRDKEIRLSLTSNDRENLHLQGILKFED